MTTGNRLSMRLGRYRVWRHGVAFAASIAALALDGCRAGEAVQSVVEYVTTSCPLGAHAVVSADSGTPGLRKLVEKWCEEKDEHAMPVRHGPYAEIFESGTKRESGQYVHGKRDGAWTRRYGSGKPESIVVYRLGRPQSFVAWHENGQKWEEGGFVDGFKQGKWIRWHANGQKEFEANFDKGTLVGVYTLWHDNGRLQEQGEYRNGQREGLWTRWHMNGQKRSEILFRDGKPEEWYRSWHENGKPYEQALFRGGRPEGTYTIWHDNGQKEEEGTYKNGMLEGEVVAYDRDGKMWMKNEYRGGTIVDDVLPDSMAKSDLSDPLKIVPSP